MLRSRIETVRFAPAGKARPSETGARGSGAGAARVRPPRARGVGEILDAALDVLVARFGVCLAIAALCWIPFQLVGEWVLGAGLSSSAQVFWALSSRVPEVLTTGFVCSLVGAQLLGREVTTEEALWNGLRAAVGVFLIALLQVLSSILLACLCLFPALLSLWVFSVAPTVYVLEREELARGPRQKPLQSFGRVPTFFRAIVRSARLVFGLASFGRWAGYALVSWIVVLWPLRMLPALAQNGLLRPLVEDITGLHGRGIGVGLAMISALFVGIATAYAAVLGTVYYIDQRVRREGLDIELRLAAREQQFSATGEGHAS